MGYRAEGGALVVAEAEAQGLDRARELRAAGMSLREIADALQREGHTARTRTRTCRSMTCGALVRAGLRRQGLGGRHCPPRTDGGTGLPP